MPENSSDTYLFQLANRIIGLMVMVVWLLFLIVFGLLIFYGYLILQPQEIMGGATRELSNLIEILWSQVTPYISQFVRLVAPIVALLFALGVLYRLSEAGARPFDMPKLLSDLPSVLALLVIVTICLLPLTGVPIPDVLNNIALVIVGFYFGKRKVADESPS